MGVYLLLGPMLGKETASWVCILAAAPVAVAGFFHYNGLTLEQFVWAFIKSEILCAGERRFVSENFYYTAGWQRQSVPTRWRTICSIGNLNSMDRAESS